MAGDRRKLSIIGLNFVSILCSRAAISQLGVCSVADLIRLGLVTHVGLTTSGSGTLSREREQRLYFALLTLASFNVFIVSSALSFLLLLYWR